MNWIDEVRKIAEELSLPDQIKVEDIPKIKLYNKQLLSFLNDNLQFFKRYEDESMLTKSMINNYSKNEISPAPQKKLYRELHIMVYTLIYQFKQFMSLDDMKVLTSKFEHTAELKKTYRVFLDEQLEAFQQLPALAEQLISKTEEMDLGDPKLILPTLLAQVLTRVQANLLFAQKLIDTLDSDLS